MNSPNQLVLAIVVVLVVATLVGRSIKRRYSPHAPHAVIDNMNTRIDAWWIIVGLVGIASWFGAGGLALLFAAASVQGLREYLPRTLARSLGVWIWLMAAAGAQYALALSNAPIAFMLLVPTGVLSILGFSALGVSPVPRSKDLAAAALLCVYCISHIPAIAALDAPNRAGSGLGPALFAVIVVQGSDVVQYIAGKLAGRHPIAPRLSPGKTVEGALAGVLGAGALGASLAGLTPYGASTAALLGVVLGALGIAGGLLFSAMKRRRGIKDWGTIIPGHGGVLDRLDSLCLSAPAFYHLLRLAPGG